jgi:hypothetical protein
MWRRQESAIGETHEGFTSIDEHFARAHKGRNPLLGLRKNLQAGHRCLRL